MKQSSKVKVQVFCPQESEGKIREVIGKAGGGKLGNYEHCSFVTKGKGYFKPTKDAKPSKGRVGEINEVNEVKIEFICDKNILEKLIKSVKKAHPYEEVAIDVIPMLEIDNLT